MSIYAYANQQKRAVEKAAVHTQKRLFCLNYRRICEKAFDSM